MRVSVLSIAATNPVGPASTQVSATQICIAGSTSTAGAALSWSTRQSGCNRRKISTPSTSSREANTGAQARKESTTTRFSSDRLYLRIRQFTGIKLPINGAHARGFGASSMPTAEHSGKAKANLAIARMVSRWAPAAA
jgi:hypothetical protein